MDAPEASRPAIPEFCQAVRGFVRFWADHKVITAEFTARLKDHRDALLEQNPALSQAMAEGEMDGRYSALVEKYARVELDRIAGFLWPESSFNIIEPDNPDPFFFSTAVSTYFMKMEKMPVPRLLCRNTAWNRSLWPSVPMNRWWGWRGNCCG